MPSDQNNFNQKVEQLFHQLLDAPGPAREHLLAEACATAPELKEAVERLLRSSENAAQNPVWSESALLLEARSSSHTDSRLDRYKLLECLGTGGMGVVYRAIRADGAYAKDVAIKIVQSAGHDPALIERFQAERQILATLEHPNIVRLLDGGATDAGVPFLVMEFIDGLPLDTWIAQNKPPVRDIVRLFRTISAAVSCAHRNLIVHRDLKPGNILVTKEGEPRLLDFGIAKALASTNRTRTGQSAMTPEYASPEQVRGAAITTSSDIWSLGVLLYEMVGNQRPWGTNRSPLDLANAICDEPPTPLSNVDPDLERIILKAMHKEPDRRYATADQFSDDLQRFLDGYPITARPDTRAYRVRKFAARNRTAVIAAFLMLAIAAAGVFATLREARLANRRFNDVRKLANSYLFELNDSIERLPGSTPARRLMARRALEYLDSLSAERGNDPALTRELAAAYEKVADIQGRPEAANLADPKAALANYQKSLDLREPLAAANPQDAALNIDIVKVRLTMGRILMFSGDLKRADSAIRAGQQLAEKTAALAVPDPALRLETQRWHAVSYSILADVTGNPNMPNLGRPDEALALYRKALALETALVAQNPTHRDLRGNLATRYGQVGQIEQTLNHGQAAIDALTHSLALHQELAAADPTDAVHRRNAAVTGRNLGIAYVQLLNDNAAGRKYTSEANIIFEDLAHTDPANIEAQLALVESWWGQAWTFGRANAREALPYFDKAIALFESLRQAHPEVAETRIRTAYQLRADARNETRDTRGAIADAQRQLDIDATLLKASPANTGALRNQGVAWMQIGRAHEILTQPAIAREWHQRAYAALTALQQAGKLPPVQQKLLAQAREALIRCGGKP